ncbi:MAG: hypothetical protein GY749_31000 [Desulfobacteraceae bacterium]|nr:hypothetical protein [Desulfobacteraceae bacterium]
MMRYLSSASMRLGLSATPRRWFDEAGTETIFSYFGKVCFEFTINDAIGKYLTPYAYYPIPVNLSPQELAEYEILSQKISVQIQGSDKKSENEEQLKKLLIKRARIIASAEQKIPKLLAILKNLMSEAAKQDKEVRNMLIYCAPSLLVSHKFS